VVDGGVVLVGDRLQFEIETHERWEELWGIIWWEVGILLGVL
jgi:hypothetical protein